MQKSIQKRLETTLAKYVAMPTVADDIPACTAAIKDVAAHFEQCGMIVNANYSKHPYLVATTTKAAMRQKHVKVLLVAHLDVVPASGEANFELRATKDKLYGRGVYDMKFAAACYKELIEDYARNNDLQAYDIGVLINTDEENAAGSVGTILDSGWTCDIAINPDGGWNWMLESRAKGILYLYLEAKGTGGHSSRPWKADNPMARLAPALDKIMHHFKNKSADGVTVSANSIIASNGTQLISTQIPEWVKVGIDIRAFTTKEIKLAESYIHKIAKRFNLTTTVILDVAPLHLVLENELVQAFMQTVQEVRGAPIKFSDAYGASDARFFAERNLPTVIMYPVGGDHHGPNEWIQRHDLYEYYVLLRKYLQKVAIRP